jgi:hypothetical protein
MRRLAVITVAVVLGWPALATVGASPGAAAARAARTSIHISRPVDAAGQVKAGYTTTRHLSGGQCSAGSDATNDAYRCFTGHFVIDPCWVTDRRAYVVCDTDNDPYTHRLVQLHVTKGYGNHNGPPGGVGSRSTGPWGVTLANGWRCHDLEGAHGSTHGQVITYSCAHTSTVLVGQVNKHRPRWRIRTARYVGHGRFALSRDIAITEAIFGGRSRKG